MSPLKISTLNFQLDLFEIEVTSVDITNDRLQWEGIYLSAEDVVNIHEIYEKTYEGYAYLSHRERIRTLSSR